MSQMRVLKDLDYDYIYKAQFKHDWFPFWITVRTGLKEPMIEYVQSCVKEGKLVGGPVVYQTAIN